MCSPCNQKVNENQKIFFSRKALLKNKYYRPIKYKLINPIMYKLGFLE